MTALDREVGQKPLDRRGGAVSLRGGARCAEVRKTVSGKRGKQEQYVRVKRKGGRKVTLDRRGERGRYSGVAEVHEEKI